MALKPYLQLVRLPNVFTAAADSLAGWLLVGGAFARPGSWGPLVLASACIYAGGIAMNDVFDAEVDRLERPGRPIPSGRVSLPVARALGATLLVLGVGLAAVAGTQSGWVVATTLVACVLAYDATGKRTVLGPEVMGACRGLNFLLGMTGVASLGGPACWLAAASYGLFVAGVTWISRSEVETGRSANVALGLGFQSVAFVGLVAAAVMGSLSLSFRSVGGGDRGWLIPGFLTLVGLAVGNVLRVRTALNRPEPATIQRAVRFGILSLVWLHVGLLLAVRGPVAAGAVSVFWFPAVYSGRWIYST